MQIAWQAWHFVTSAEIWRKASQYLWGKLQDLRFGRSHCTCLASQYLWGKLQNLDCSKLSQCQNWRKSRTKCLFSGSHMCYLVSLAFLWLLSIYGGSCKTLTVRSCHSVKIGGSLARNARFHAPRCVILSLWLSSGFAASIGEAAKP